MSQQMHAQPFPKQISAAQKKAVEWVGGVNDWTPKRKNHQWLPLPQVKEFTVWAPDRDTAIMKLNTKLRNTGHALGGLLYCRRK